MGRNNNRFFLLNFFRNFNHGGKYAGKDLWRLSGLTLCSSRANCKVWPGSTEAWPIWNWMSPMRGTRTWSRVWLSSWCSCFKKSKIFSPVHSPRIRGESHHTATCSPPPFSPSLVRWGDESEECKARGLR